MADRAAGISADDREDYRLIANGDAPRSSRSVAALRAAGLIDEDPRQTGTYIAMDPRAAAHDLLIRARADLETVVQQLEQVPALERLADHYDPQRWYGGPASEFLSTRQQMNARIGQVTAKAQSEIYAAQPEEPADRPPEIVRLGTERVRAALGRGVRVRALYAGTAGAHAETREYAAEITSGGAQVRALGGHFPRMVLIDGHDLFIENHVIDGAETNSGWHVTDPGIVAWGRAVFDIFWGLATRWEDLGTTPAVTTARQRAILRALADGVSQQAIGPSLTIGDRTVAKELAALRTALGAHTVYQVMAWWGSSSERRLP